MLTEALQAKAAHYVSGAMEAAERANFEILLEFQMELRSLVAEMQDLATAVALTDAGTVSAPPDALKARIVWAISATPRPVEPAGLVATDAQGRIEWVSAGFTAMCGYSLAELRGRKPGQVLQGPETDPIAVARIREALRSGLECRESLVNYHKDGSRYGVDLRIGCIADDEGTPLAFVAREWKRPV